MEIKYALLGFLSWKDATGYELKKHILNSVGFEWSGNNNQIYTSLVQLHRENMVTSQVQPQERYPARKVYSITETGRQALKEWVAGNPEPPVFRKSFLVQLAWAGQLSETELDSLLAKYEREVKFQLLMLETRMRRGSTHPGRTGIEKYLWDKIAENYVLAYEAELKWVKQIRSDIGISRAE
jgi:DNA-binding PadR family transcriptional regulator